MALIESSGAKPKRKKHNAAEAAERLLEEEREKQKKGDRRESYKIANKEVTKDTPDSIVEKLLITSLYAAPYNEEWNDFSKLSADKAYELNQSIVDGGLLTPIIVWKINKAMLKDLYIENNDVYGFVGSEYMILAGHSRTYAYVELYNQTKDDRYLKIDAIIKENLTYDQAQYIIKVTNFVNRELSLKEKRRNIKFMHRTLNNSKTKGMNIAKKIAEDSGSKLRTVQYNISINEKLIPEFIDMYDNESITQGSAIRLTRLTKPMQQWLYKDHKDDITDNILKGLKPSYKKKEEIENIFKARSYGKNISVTIDVPIDLESKFKSMASKWINKQISKK